MALDRRCLKLWLPPNLLRRKLISLVEFVRQKDPKNHPDTVVTFVYYLHKYKGIPTFNIDDMEKCYGETRMSRPANINDVINRVVSKGYLSPSEEPKDDKKAWFITQTGDRYVESGLAERGD